MPLQSNYVACIKNVNIPIKNHLDADCCVYLVNLIVTFATAGFAPYRSFIIFLKHCVWREVAGKSSRLNNIQMK